MVEIKLSPLAKADINEIADRLMTDTFQEIIEDDAESSDETIIWP